MRRISKSLALLAIFLVLPVREDGCAAAADVSSKMSMANARAHIGLVLSGGGARGLAHIGVLRALEKLRVPIDCIAGTSMGALVAGAYASGISPQEMADKVGRIDWSDIFTNDAPRTVVPWRGKKDDYHSYFDMEVGWREGHPLMPPGTTSGYKFELFIRELIGPEVGDDARDFDSLPIPYRAVATDLVQGAEKLFAHGDLARVMRASMSVPGVIAPVEIDGHLYVDGGLVNNLPVQAARQMCADVVIAVNLGTPLMAREDLQSALAVSAQSLHVLTERNVDASLAALHERDILISPLLQDIGAGDFTRGLEAIPRGEQAVQDNAGALQGLSVSDTEYVAWQRGRAARRPIAPGVIGYRFAPTEHVSTQVLVPELRLATGDAFSQAEWHQSLVKLFGRGDFERVGYHFEDTPEGRTAVLEPVEKSWGPTYLKFGLGLATDFQDTTRVGFAAHHRRTWLNSRGAEWRSDLQIGSAISASTEFFQPYSARRGSTFAAIRADYSSEPEIYYLEGKRVGEYDVTTARVHVDIGAQNRFGEFRLGVFSGDLRAKEDFGFFAGLLPNYDISQSGITGRFVFDQLDSADFPRHGLALTGNIFSTRADMGSDDDYDKAEVTAQWAGSWGRHTIVPALLMGDSLGSELPLYDTLHIGGLLRLSGYRIDELRAFGYTVGRIAYYYRYAVLPPQLGGGVYVGASAELGRVREGSDASVTRHPQAAGSLSLGAETVLGPLRLAVGLAEGGQHAVYFLLGRLLPL